MCFYVQKGDHVEKDIHSTCDHCDYFRVNVISIGFEMDWWTVEVVIKQI